MQLIKRIAGYCLGDRNVGRLEFLIMPQVRDSLGGPLNGQVFRKRMFLDIVRATQCAAIVETGTFRGSSTAFFATLDVPVYSVEQNPRHAAFASLRLARLPGRIHLSEGNSPAFLKSLAVDPTFPRSHVIFYLDAHWYAHLPLAEELEIVFATWHDAVVMVDDFQVPGTSYGYDDYGPGKALTLDYLKQVGHLELKAFFPRATADAETGQKRGSVVLCRDPDVARTLSGLETLVAEESLQIRTV